MGIELMRSEVRVLGGIGGGAGKWVSRFPCWPYPAVLGSGSKEAEEVQCLISASHISRLLLANQEIDNSLRQKSIDIIERQFHDLSAKCVSTNITRGKDKNQVGISKAKGLRDRHTAWIEFPIFSGQVEVRVRP
jgi:hypothetical protein